MTQLLGVGAYGAFAFTGALLIFGLLKATVGIRVSEEEEIEGLDYGEHGMHAYDFGPGPSWAEQAPGLATAQSAPVPTRTLATNES